MTNDHSQALKADLAAGAPIFPGETGPEVNQVYLLITHEGSAKTPLLKGKIEQILDSSSSDFTDEQKDMLQRILRCMERNTGMKLEYAAAQGVTRRDANESRLQYSTLLKMAHIHSIFHPQNEESLPHLFQKFISEFFPENFIASRLSPAQKAGAEIYTDICALTVFLKQALANEEWGDVLGQTRKGISTGIAALEAKIDEAKHLVILRATFSGKDKYHGLPYARLRGLGFPAAG